MCGRPPGKWTRRAANKSTSTSCDKPATDSNECVFNWAGVDEEEEDKEEFNGYSRDSRSIGRGHLDTRKSPRLANWAVRAIARICDLGPGCHPQCLRLCSRLEKDKRYKLV